MISERRSHDGSEASGPDFLPQHLDQPLQPERERGAQSTVTTSRQQVLLSKGPCLSLVKVLSFLLMRPVKEATFKDSACSEDVST